MAEESSGVNASELCESLIKVGDATGDDSFSGKALQALSECRAQAERDAAAAAVVKAETVQR